MLSAVAMFAIAVVRRIPLPTGPMLGALVLLGALGYGGQAFSFFTALTLAPAGLCALLLYLHPALVALLAAVFLHERLTAQGAELALQLTEERQSHCAARSRLARSSRTSEVAQAYWSSAIESYTAAAASGRPYGPTGTGPIVLARCRRLGIWP